VIEVLEDTSLERLLDAAEKDASDESAE